MANKTKSLNQNYDHLFKIGENARRNPLERRSLTGGDKLKCPIKEGFTRYWFNMEPGVLEEAASAGWMPVENSEMITGGGGIADVEGMGSVVIRPLGGGKDGMLMEIPDEVIAETRKVTQDAIDAEEKRMERNSNVPDEDRANPAAASGQYGLVSSGNRANQGTKIHNG